MKEIDGIEYYSIDEIYKKLDENIPIEKIREDIKENRLKGKEMSGRWYATNEQIFNYLEIIKKEIVHFAPSQTLNLNRYSFNGRILDIGGGGEGIIGQLSGESVVAIDLHKEEFHEAIESGDNKSLKIIMDATDLKFLDETFETITAFFSLMYMSPEDQEKVFSEIYRVLKPSGELYIWDLEIPKNKTNKKQFYGIPLKIKIGETTIETGYATKWDNKIDRAYYIDLAKNNGFKLIQEEVSENTFFLKLKK
ncbi:MAG: methyltransferase domain-containing protein [Candidatus Lokiarchaeota archaeon]|nr:methyltransferase domain-containing protein [Candidatus Lokiarchaeota archaeon]MBD3199489.1 methyltransferase domain-containing protein [Candidatus Lokiarchaeota archaeon]